MSSATCAFVAGESSGDLLAAGVVGRLRSQEPALRCVAALHSHDLVGFEAWAHVRELSVRGYVEVLRHLPRLLACGVRSGAGCWRTTGHLCRRRRTDFNLGLEEQLRASGIRVVHYVSRRSGPAQQRIHQIRRAVDRMLLVFPFEQRIYDAAGIPPPTSAIRSPT
jgi:lipid-A-disaccharide synthase